MNQPAFRYFLPALFAIALIASFFIKPNHYVADYSHVVYQPDCSALLEDDATLYAGIRKLELHRGDTVKMEFLCSDTSMHVSQYMDDVYFGGEVLLKNLYSMDSLGCAAKLEREKGRWTDSYTTAKAFTLFQRDEGPQRVPDRALRAFDWLNKLSPVGISIAWIVMMAIELFLIFALHSFYGTHYQRKSPVPAYVAFIPGFAGVLYMISVFRFAPLYGLRGDFIWLAFLMACLPLAVQSLWKLYRNSKPNWHPQNRRIENIAYSSLYFTLWALLIIPLIVVCYDITDCRLRDLGFVSDDFLTLCIAVIGMGVLNIFVFRKILYFISINCLRPLGNGVMLLLYLGVAFILSMAELDVIHAFNGLNYFIAVFFWVICSSLLLLSFFTLLNSRCTNCHNFSGVVTDQDFGATKVKDSYHWNSIGKYSVNSRHPERVFNAQELWHVRSYSRMIHSKYVCENCDESWVSSYEQNMGSDSDVVRQEWKELGD